MNKLQYLQYLGRLGNQGKVAITDSDAKTYISAVETADNQSLEFGVKVAIQNFIVGAKADGIWDAIKSSAILAGARTLNGALRPLKGTAPTNFNFVAGDYNRKTGLVGDGSTKYLDSNRNNNADPQNSKHVGFYLSSVGTAGKGIIATDTNIGATQLLYGSNNLFFHRFNSSTGTSTGLAMSAGFSGASRNNVSSYIARGAGANSVVNVASDGVINSNLLIFRRTVLEYSDARLSFYSIGEALDLALLDTRVTQLMTDLGNAIP